MSLTDLLHEGRLQRHRTSAQEIADLLRVVERDLADARVEAISDDLRFTAAYGPALSLATIALHCARHHATTFEALPLVMGADLAALADYLDACRTKRNQVGYRRSGEVTLDEVEDLIEAVAAFEVPVREWLRAEHPNLL